MQHDSPSGKSIVERISFGVFNHNQNGKNIIECCTNVDQGKRYLSCCLISNLIFFIKFIARLTVFEREKVDRVDGSKTEKSYKIQIIFFVRKCKL